MPKPPDWDKAVLLPLKQKQDEILAACQAQDGTLDGLDCVLPPPPPPVVYTAPVYVPVIDNLYGSLGYSLPWGNCVNEPGVNNPGWGNPIQWGVTSYSPWIGASALFWFNHVGVVSGIWSNGDIEVRQQNSPGMPHRIPMGMVRGFR